MAMSDDQRYESMKRRFEQLKRYYFKGEAYGRTTDEVPLYTRQQIVQMFDSMGVELPLSPSDPMRMKQKQGTPR